ncbi:MAG: ABC transporter permease subunit [Rhodoglobus sp.]
MVWLWNNLGLVLSLTLEHARLSAVPIVVGFAASIPLGWLANRYRIARGILLPTGSILFTIPSIALFVSLPLVLGTKILDPTNVVVALTIYAVAIMVRGAADAFGSVSADVQLSATAIGNSPWTRFWSVQFPLAGPVLLANLRVVSVSTVSLLSVAALVGNGGLGYLFINGYQRDFPEEVLVGIIAILLLALLFDLVLVVVGRLLMPWERLRRRPSRLKPVHDSAVHDSAGAAL